MNYVLNALMSIGPIALLAALVLASAYYAAYRFAPEPKKNVSVVRYILMVLVVGALGFAVGTAIGISVSCSSDNAGNLCGLGGFFGMGPLLSGVAIFVYAHLWAKGARSAR